MKDSPAGPKFNMMQEETVQPSEKPQEPKPLEQQLAEALATIEQQRDAMMRALADADNARKRALSEASSARRFAVERFAESLLPVLDSLEAAQRSADLSGVELTLRQMQAAFEKAGMAEIAPQPGARFDPNRHHAVAAVASEAEPNSVVAVMQKGYSLHDRVLRPAMVTVAKSKSDPISDKDLN